MRKNLLGVLVVLFVIFACILVIKEANTNSNPQIDSQQFYVDSNTDLD
ncbi:hypothetical protein [Mangrovimonas cancribranchiae]|uniref:Uncharacterized protein n=1 Tax=Mangrovimonas cancribranchiae TaxID=3080055 RepID=A0AAU6NWN8_9FLAO